MILDQVKLATVMMGENCPQLPIIDFVNKTIITALECQASDIHFEAFADCARLRYRRDGLMKEIVADRDFLFDNYLAIISRIKILACLDISERRLPQDGRISFKSRGFKVDIRVSVLPTANGERVVMRLLSQSNLSIPIDKLNFTAQQLEHVKQAIESPQGMILVTGPTGSGKTTTLYAILNYLNKDEVNILTAEDPVEVSISGINQVQVKDCIGLTFAAALRSFLRQDPEIIMVGEIRDTQTAEISVKASLTGHLVLSTLHTNNAVNTVTRLSKMGVPSYMLASSLSLVIAQRLARIICQYCKVDDTNVVPAKLKAIGFTDKEIKSFSPKKGIGCSKCMGMGSSGRLAIHEVFTVTNDIKSAILDDACDLELTKIAQEKDAYVLMRDRGRQLIAEGEISVAEYERILVVDH